MKKRDQSVAASRHVTKAFWRLCATVAFFGIMSPASADMVTVTFSGTVRDGFDQLGVFGTPNTSLTGDAYTAVYYTNTGVGFVANPAHLIGGTGTATFQPSPVLGFLITISRSHRESDDDHFTGHSVFIDAGYAGDIRVSNSEVSYFAQDGFSRIFMEPVEIPANFFLCNQQLFAVPGA